MRDLKKDTGAVAGGFVRTGRPAVVKVNNNLLAVFNDRMGPFTQYVYDRTDSTGIVLVPGLIQSMIFQLCGHHYYPR
jgi:hypothetical protein